MSKQPNKNPFAPLAVGFFIGAITFGTTIAGFTAMASNLAATPPRNSHTNPPAGAARF